MVTDIDLHIGRRLRRRRRLLSLTQQQLGSVIGIRFQQIQKYECGANRVSAARLWQLAQALEVPVNYFYDGIGQTPAQTWRDRDPVDPRSGEVRAVEGRVGEARTGEVLARKETQDLIAAYYQLGESPRRRLLDLAKSLNGKTAP